MKILIDGNPGTGRKTLTEQLVDDGMTVIEGGIPGLLTARSPTLPKADELYLILEAPVAVVQRRLIDAGHDLSKPAYRHAELTYAHNRFREISGRIPRCVCIDASGSPKNTYRLATSVIKALQNS